MTEHTKIPRPEDSAGRVLPEQSLFERASGAFGLDALRPAAVPEGLDAPVAKRAQAGSPDNRRESESVPRPVFKPEIVDRPEPLPRPVSNPGTAGRPEPAPIASDPPFEAAGVRFSGPRHKIDRQHLRNQCLIVPEGAVSALLEEFRIVKRDLIGTAKERGTAAARRVLICSPHPGEGKTFCAANLAIAMASERDSEVLLVDADFAKPSILSTFGLPKGPGLMDALADAEIDPEDLVLGTDISGLWVLPAGNMTNVDSEYLSSTRTAEVLDRLTEGAPNRMVIFDTPPALAASPAAELAKHVGQAVLIARADRTGQSALEDAVRLLSGCADIKLLLNGAHFSPSGRRFGTYYGYEE